MVRSKVSYVFRKNQNRNRPTQAETNRPTRPETNRQAQAQRGVVVFVERVDMSWNLLRFTLEVKMPENWSF